MLKKTKDIQYKKQDVKFWSVTILDKLL